MICCLSYSFTCDTRAANFWVVSDDGKVGTSDWSRAPDQSL